MNQGEEVEAEIKALVNPRFHLLGRVPLFLRHPRIYEAESKLVKKNRKKKKKKKKRRGGLTQGRLKPRQGPIKLVGKACVVRAHFSVAVLFLIPFRNLSRELGAATQGLQ